MPCLLCRGGSSLGVGQMPMIASRMRNPHTITRQLTVGRAQHPQKCSRVYAAVCSMPQSGLYVRWDIGRTRWFQLPRARASVLPFPRELWPHRRPHAWGTGCMHINAINDASCAFMPGVAPYAMIASQRLRLVWVAKKILTGLQAHDNNLPVRVTFGLHR